MNSYDQKNKPNYKSNYRLLSMLQRKIRNNDQSNTVIEANSGNNKNGTEKSKGSDIKWTDKAQVIINGLMVLATFGVIWVAVIQNKSSEISAKAAQDAVDVSNKALDFAKRSDSTNDSNFNRTLRISRQGLDEQIKLVQNTEKQFKTSNEPYLQIINPTIKQFEAGKFVFVGYSITNYGVYPVKVLSSKIMLATKVIPNDFSELRLGGENNLQIINTYITKGTSLVTEYSFDNILRAGSFENVKNGKYSIFFTGFIQYENLIEKKVKYYKFQVRFHINPESKLIGELIVNENTDNY